MELRRHQREALEAIAGSQDQRHWVVLPPGAGKTLVGVEAAAGWERPVVAFGPNHAIVTQWRTAWESHTGTAASSDRDLPTGFTALTYQSLAVFDSDSDEPSPKARLHPNGQALVRRLHDLGPLTLILDECHHLLEVWGSLLDEIIAELPDATVIALTATPPELLTAGQAERVDRLFGSITYQAGIPTLVAEGDLAPFAELAWFTTPTARESEWLDARAVRAAELITELTGVDLKVPFLSWIALHDFRDFEPLVGDAVVRLALAGHLDLPEHAHVSERHRRDVTLEDWLTVADRWLQALSALGGAEAAFERRIAALLPGVGYRMTRKGLRPGQPLVDRVLSRSASKSLAAAEIVAQTVASDTDSRLLVLTDFANATALPADLDGVLEPQSGSARWLLEALVTDERIAAARPVMVTGTSIGAGASVLRALLPDERVEGEGVVVLEGTSSSRWLAAATGALNRGWTRCLVGTRGLLGEGWDARAVTGVIDLTSATTSTAIVQTRGRSLRSDPLHPDKVAVNWTVTCVAADRPQGDVDYRRLVRKHTGWFAVDEEGDVVDGVAHLSSRLTPEAPPPWPKQLNAASLERALDHEPVRNAWDAVDPLREHPVATLRIVGDRAPVPVGVPAVPERTARETALPYAVGIGVGALSMLGTAVGLVAAPVTLVIIAIMITLFWVAGWRGAVERNRRLQRAPSTSDYARAVADALAAAGLSSVGAEGVVVEVTAGGETRIRLEARPNVPGFAAEGSTRASAEALDEAVTELFTTSLAEVLGPLEQPRYLISRPVWEPRPPSLADGFRTREADREVWHQVPMAFGVSRVMADLFAEAWSRHVAEGQRAVFAGASEGAALLRALRWSSPFGDAAGLSIVERRHW